VSVSAATPSCGNRASTGASPTSTKYGSPTRGCASRACRPRQSRRGTGGPSTVDVSLAFRISDPLVAMMRLQKPEDSCAGFAQVAVARFIKTRSYAEITLDDLECVVLDEVASLAGRGLAFAHPRHVAPAYRRGRPLMPMRPPTFCPVPPPVREPWPHEDKSRQARGYGRFAEPVPCEQGDPPHTSWDGKEGLRACILERDHHTCGYCGRHATTVDHRTPKAQGGTNVESNLLACCAACQQSKAGREGHAARFKR
jgi:HNH endonuclease